MPVRIGDIVVLIKSEDRKNYDFFDEMNFPGYMLVIDCIASSENQNNVRSACKIITYAGKVNWIANYKIKVVSKINEQIRSTNDATNN
tara:strand:+ start:860 stop:1123 length:264 start_codon:yes stop_codon:yes gene_type:complete